MFSEEIYYGVYLYSIFEKRPESYITILPDDSNIQLFYENTLNEVTDPVYALDITLRKYYKLRIYHIENEWGFTPIMGILVRPSFKLIKKYNADLSKITVKEYCDTIKDTYAKKHIKRIEKIFTTFHHIKPEFDIFDS